MCFGMTRFLGSLGCLEPLKIGHSSRNYVSLAPVFISRFGIGKTAAASISKSGEKGGTHHRLDFVLSTRIKSNAVLVLKNASVRKSEW